MPSKEMLRAELVAVINAPLSRLAAALKHNLNKLVYYMEQRKDKITK
jgi:ribosomal protein L10